MLIILYILIILNIFSFLLGYILGSKTHNTINGYSRNNQKQHLKKNNIEIDDKKVVLNIDTTGLEKKYDSLGNMALSETSIENSINKLKNLKR